jgi:hypothetical protein
VTTAELGLVTTAIVGVAAAGGPTLTAWANRRQERAMGRSTRRYEQRRQTYKDLGVFLESQRLVLERVAQAPAGAKPPDDLSDEAWADLLGRAAVEGSNDVHAKLDAYAKAAHRVLGAAMTFEMLEQRRARDERPPDGWVQAQASVDEARKAARKAIDDTEQTMRDELLSL